MLTFILILIIIVIIVFVASGNSKPKYSASPESTNFTDSPGLDDLDYPAIDEFKSSLEMIEDIDEFYEKPTGVYIFKNLPDQEDSILRANYEVFEDLIFNSSFGLSYIIVDDVIVLRVSFPQDDISMVKGDSVTLLFEDESEIHSEFNYTTNNTNNYFSPTMEQMKLLCTQNLHKWKLTSKRKNIYEMGDFSLFSISNPVQNKFMFQEVFKMMSIVALKKYADLVADKSLMDTVLKLDENCTPIVENKPM